VLATSIVWLTLEAAGSVPGVGKDQCELIHVFYDA
jgi:hypothetical protein